MVPERFFITTPIYYVNAEPHVGHAYTTIMSDILARHQRQRGEDVFFLTGTDEHGDKIARAAEAAGRTPKEHTDVLSEEFRELWGTLGLSQDFFIRTTDPEHIAGVQAFVQRMYDAGDVYRGSYGGWYCTYCEAFYTEEELLEGHRCPQHLRPVEWVEEDNWFFRLSAYRDRLLAHYDRRPDFVRPHHRGREARRIIEGVEDVSISRANVRWGVPVPWEPGQVIYVWIDALLNYYTALAYARPGEDLTERLWPPDLQVLGKDILKFHAVIWPAMLMSVGLELPRGLFVHGFVLKGGERLSKTTGNLIDPLPYVRRYGLDPLRYYLAREIRFGEDGSFSEEGFEARYNGELANELGNLLSRTVAMVERYRDGVVPEDPGDDAALAAEVAERVGAVRGAFDRVDVTQAAEEAWRLVRRLNQLVEERAPWVLARQPERARELDQALASLVEGLRTAAVLLWPFIPGSAERVLTALGQPPERVDLERAAWGAGAPGARVVPGEPLFPRLDEERAA
jgi:methionyl-tRNA synthetase